MTRHTPHAIRHCVVLAALVAAWMIGSSAPVRGQNPITAAREAFRKAREDAKRPAQPGQPVQPPEPAAPVPQAQPAQSAAKSAPSPTAATAECCSPAALSKLAASVGFIDIVGVKLGMTPQEAMAALKASNPKLVIDVHDAELTMGAKQGRRARVILAHLPAGGRNPEIWGNLDGSHEAIGIQLTPPPGPLVVEEVVRYVSFPSNAPVATSNILDGLRKKYGTENVTDRSSFVGWVFDNTGKPVAGMNPQDHCAKPPNLSLSGGDIRGGSSATAPGRVFGSLNTDLQEFETTDKFNQLSAKCVPYVIARAEMHLTAPNTVDFWTMMSSGGLIHNSLALTAAYVKGEVESQIKQQEDAASKRAVPKL